MKLPCQKCQNLGFIISLKASKLYACGYVKLATKCWRCNGSGTVKVKG